MAGSDTEVEYSDPSLTVTNIFVKTLPELLWQEDHATNSLTSRKMFGRQNVKSVYCCTWMYY